MSKTATKTTPALVPFVIPQFPSHVFADTADTACRLFKSMAQMADERVDQLFSPAQRLARAERFGPIAKAIGPASKRTYSVTIEYRHHTEPHHRDTPEQRADKVRASAEAREARAHHHGGEPGSGGTVDRRRTGARARRHSGADAGCQPV